MVEDGSPTIFGDQGRTTNASGPSAGGYSNAKHARGAWELGASLVVPVLRPGRDERLVDDVSVVEWEKAEFCDPLKLTPLELQVGRRSGGDQTVSDGVLREIGGRMKPKLPRNAGLMKFHGFDRHAED